MATRTWIGGGNNHASNPADWSPHGAPQPGDTLVVGGSDLTMNVRDTDLAGDSLSVSDPNFTANLSRGADVTALTGLGSGAPTFNLSHNSTLNLTAGFDNPTVNIAGNDTFVSNSGRAEVTVNLKHGATWSGTFDADNAVYTVNGGCHTAFNNDGSSNVVMSAPTTIGVDVIGVGSFDLILSRLEFVRSVGPGQSILDNGTIQVDRPHAFDARVILASQPVGAVDLMGLATADSYSFKHDLLSIWSGHKVIDTLRLTDQTQYGFDVVKTAGSVNVVALTTSGQTLPGALPIHVG